MRAPHTVLRLAVAATAMFLAACSNADRAIGPEADTAPPQLALAGGTGSQTTLVSRLGADRCLTVRGGSRTLGTPLVLGTCSGATEQQFTWRSNGEIRVFGGTLCVDASSGRGQNGNPIVLWTCHGGANQKWTATSAGEIRGINSKCVDVARSNTANGAQILLWSCHGGTNQKWDNGSGTAATPPAPAPAPTSGTPIYPGESIQSKVNAAPAGTQFVIKAGTHRRQSVVPKAGNRFVGEPGAILDGERAVAYAFYHGSAPFPNNVTIKGLVIKNYNPPIPFAAIRAGGHYASDGASGWTVESNEIAYNAAGGVRIATGMKLLRNKIHHNTWIGVIGAGNNVLVEGNEISYHNIAGTVDVAAFGAGGTKFVDTDGLVVRNNFSHHNNGPGFWTDLNNINTIYEDNRVEDNTQTGIFHEISYKAIIRNNRVARNGFKSGWLYGGGITISASPDVEIYGNTVTDNYNGITGVQQRRDEPAKYGAHVLQNMYVHDNTVYMAKSKWTGIGVDVADGASYYTTRGNRWVNNTYYLGTNKYPFHWSNPFTNEDMWRSNYKQDLTAKFYR